MGFAFGHLVTAWFFGKIAEYIRKITLDRYTWFFLLFGAILPDADFLIDWTFGVHVHRTFTHSLFFVVLAGAIMYLLFTAFRDQKKTSFALAISVGILSHSLLDFFSGRGVPFLWPDLTYYSFFEGIRYNPQVGIFLKGPADFLRQSLKFAIVDMAIGTTWLFYLWWRKRIRF